MNDLLLISLLTGLAGVLLGLLIASRRGPAADAPYALADMRMFRQVDKMILSNLSFEYVAQQIVDLIPAAHRILGVTLRTADERTGQLDVAAVSSNLNAPGDALGLHALVGSAIEPTAAQRSGSRTVQAVNQRQVEAGDSLSAFEAPTIKAATAGKIQAHLGIKAIVSYPVMVESQVVGALTFYFDRSTDSLSEHDHEIMQGITDEVGIAIENSRLTSQLEGINRQLAEANSHLKEVDALKDDFIAIASHQLRSPLTAIKGYLSMLNEGDFGKLQREQAAILGQLSHSTNEVINLINDMLSVSRINAQKFELAKTAIDLEELVHDVFLELGPLAQKKSLAFTLEAPAHPLGQLNLDPLRIRQVVINLIDNAIKYTDQGSVKVRLEQADGQIRFTVTDTGIGIPVDEHDQMFKKFYRASNARTVVVSGSGLGLYVAREIVEKHRGSMILESAQGKGSTVGFSIPFATAAVETTSATHKVAA